MSEKIHVLRLDASASPEVSTSRKLGDRLIEQKQQADGEIELRQRDLNQNLAFIDSDWIEANFTAADARSPAQRERLALSDQLLEELNWADHIVLTTPMYNFGIPSTLKAWIDLVCRAGLSFRYTENGPEGLLKGKSADIVITTGGAPLHSPVDFVSGYLRQVMSFIGIDQVEIYGADRMNIDAEKSLATATAQIEQAYTADAKREVA
ncbi:MAG: FMN-dependent NADH-azoreductase [Gammaproteobacteria bacterium]|nr:MAG: FMN-dependent NADH-azoreductase [Gammaproteobacteria bacterium]